MKLLALGLKRFCYSLQSVKVPRDFTHLYKWLLEQSVNKYGAAIDNAIEVIYNAGSDGISRDIWLRAMKFGQNGAKINISEFEILKFQSVLLDWAVVVSNKDGTIKLTEKFSIAYSKMKRKLEPTRNLLSACLSLINESSIYSGTKLMAEALKMLPSAYFKLGEIDSCKRLLYNRGFIQSAAKQNVLSTIAKSYKLCKVTKGSR